MEMKSKIIAYGLFLSLCINYAYGQKYASIGIGEKIPLDVWNKIPKKTGEKLIILDFWNTYCTSCIASFPKIKQLQAQYDKQLQFVLVNSTEDDATVTSRLNKINQNRSEEMKIKLPVKSLNNDKVLLKLFPYKSVPHQVWVNGNREIIAITFHEYATSQNIAIALSGKPISLPLKSDNVSEDLKYNGLMESRNTLLNPVYYSSFTHHRNELGAGYNLKRDTINKVSRFTYKGYPIIKLLEVAFTEPNALWFRYINELKNKNSIILPEDSTKMDWLDKNRYSYETQVSISEEKQVRSYMQQDISRFLKSATTMEVVIEKRKVTALIVVTKEASLLKTAGGKSFGKKEQRQFVCQNQPFKYFLNDILYSFEDMSKPRIIIDETGYKGNIDMTLTGDLDDIANIKKQLPAYGLDIIQEERTIDVLVIKDKK
jgi:thiol-disulfide isomerase/thioredoxin